jgi:hypothetical protein
MRYKLLKFGIEIPYDFENAESLDNENGNTFWRDACALEMKQLLEYKTFQSLDFGASIPDGCEKIKGKIVYDCKHDYRRRVWCVACGDLTKKLILSQHIPLLYL